MDSTPSYPDFFDSVTDATSSAPPNEFAHPAPKSSTIKPDTPETLRQKINTRRDAYMKKAGILRARIETEKGKLKTLGERYEYKAGNTALNRRIWRSSNYLSMVVTSFNRAMAEHCQHMVSEDLSDVAMAIARSKVLEIESRLRAVEVALQGAIEHGVPEDRTGGILHGAEVAEAKTVVKNSSATVAADAPEKIDFVREEWFLRLLAAGHQRKNLPPVGYYKV